MRDGNMSSIGTHFLSYNPISIARCSFIAASGGFDSDAPEAVYLKHIERRMVDL